MSDAGTLEKPNGPPGRRDGRRTEEEYRHILETDPENVVALHGMGWIAYQSGRWEDAIGWLQQAVRRQENNAGLHNNLGVVLHAAGRVREAEESYARALRLKADFAEAYNNLGNVLREQGRLGEAVARYHQAVLARPRYAEARSNLGLALKAVGRTAEALTHLQEALRLQPDSWAVHNTLGLLLGERGQTQEAESHLREALRLQPDDAAGRVNLGLLLLDQGRTQEAVEQFEAAACQSSRLPEVHNRLGHAFLRLREMDRALAHFDQARKLKETGTSDRSVGSVAGTFSAQPARTEADAAQTCESSLAEAAALHERAVALRKAKKSSEADAACRESLRIHPDYAGAHVTLGLILEDQGRLREAETAFHHALRIQPDHAEAFMHIGKSLREAGHLEKALDYLHHALAIKPDLAEAHVHLGLTLADRGKLDDAASAYRAALRLHPDLVPALSHLGCLLDELGEPEEGRRLLERAVTLGSEEHQVHFQFGTLLVNQGRFDEARAHFTRTLELQPGYSPVYFALARDSKYTFGPEDCERIKSLLAREDLPLRDRVNFHLALARVLDRGKDYDGAFHHCEEGNSCKHRLLQLQGSAFDSEQHAHFLDRLITTFDADYFHRVKTIGMDSDLPVFVVGMPRSGTSLVEQILASHPAVFGAGELRTMRQLVADIPVEVASNLDYPECLTNLDQVAAKRLAGRYLEVLRRLGGNCLRVTDKVPMNFHQLGLIATLFPRCRIIHCRRDPRDLCWSCYFQNFREVHFACDLKTLGNYHRQYERLMNHWKKVLPIPIFDVSYEGLVQNPEQVSRQIVAACGLPWDERCLDFYQTQRSVRTSSNLQVRQPVYKSSVGYWRNYERHLRPLFEVLNQT